MSGTDLRSNDLEEGEGASSGFSGSLYRILQRVKHEPIFPFVRPTVRETRGTESGGKESGRENNQINPLETICQKDSPQLFFGVRRVILNTFFLRIIFKSFIHL